MSSKDMQDGPPEEVLDRLAGLLPPEQLEDALEGLSRRRSLGPGGLLTQLAGRVIETALGAELTGHLGHPPGQAPPGGAPNVRTARPRRRSGPSSARSESGRRATARAASSLSS
jgi:hypothetical protein